MTEVLDNPPLPTFIPTETIKDDLTPNEPIPELISTVPADVDPTKFRLAYGRRGIPKMVY